MRLIGVWNNLSPASNAVTGLSGGHWKKHDSVEDLFIGHKVLLRRMRYEYEQILSRGSQHNSNANQKKRKQTRPTRSTKKKITWNDYSDYDFDDSDPLLGREETEEDNVCDNPDDLDLNTPTNSYS
eukprot:2313737-Ditylum_brightwellii.AAC.1